MLLENLYGDEIYNLKQQIVHYNSKTFNIYSSNFHFEIYLNQNNFDKKEFNKIMKKMSDNLNIITHRPNIFLIKNCEYLAKENLFLIKKLCEKKKIIFIFLTNNYNYVYNYTTAFIKIRVPILKENELISLLKFIKKNEKIKIYVKDIKEIISNNKNNINKILLNLEIFKHTKNTKLENSIDNTLDSILGLVYKKKLDNILKIRKLVYDLCSKNVNRYYILKYSLRKLLKQIDSNKKKIELTSFVNEINVKLSESFKNTIHIEYFFIKLYEFIE